jgi:hypothetical protein
MQVSQQTRMIAALRSMLDELCSPELTLGRAKILRPRLFELLGTMNSRDAGASAWAGCQAEVGSDRTTATRLRDSQEALHLEFTAFPKILQGPCVG